MDAPVYKAERIDDHIMFNCYLNNMSWWWFTIGNSPFRGLLAMLKNIDTKTSETQALRKIQKIKHPLEASTLSTTYVYCFFSKAVEHCCWKLKFSALNPQALFDHQSAGSVVFAPLVPMPPRPTTGSTDACARSEGRLSLSLYLCMKYIYIYIIYICSNKYLWEAWVNSFRRIVDSLD